MRSLCFLQVVRPRADVQAARIARPTQLRSLALGLGKKTSSLSLGSVTWTWHKLARPIVWRLRDELVAFKSGLLSLDPNRLYSDIQKLKLPFWNLATGTDLCLDGKAFRWCGPQAWSGKLTMKAKKGATSRPDAEARGGNGAASCHRTLQLSFLLKHWPIHSWWSVMVFLRLRPFVFEGIVAILSTYAMPRKCMWFLRQSNSLLGQPKLVGSSRTIDHWGWSNLPVNHIPKEILHGIPVAT